ncbi:MAG TPA: dUTP diphosphatase [bacterium]|nr:dUTP diphosphatase [bacterium]HMW35502.1 dUTP diphosphatase [bacterium]HMZ05419.1 dUTP diphosphatase [bacterium]HNB09369.1 dUTP diphosphatase [bacterium]HNB56277.1 dUTP diphosphatase [bacterium]
MPVVKIQKLHPDAKLPSYAHPGDAGLDVCSVERVEILPHASALIKTGFCMQLPDGTEAQVRPRSGLALKHQITVLNSPGTIDHGYRGEVGIILINHGSTPFIVEPGMKIAQMVIAEVLHAHVEEATELTDSSRGQGGFGSTGR